MPYPALWDKLCLSRLGFPQLASMSALGMWARHPSMAAGPSWAKRQGASHARKQPGDAKATAVASSP
eukprot:1558486-Pyramimonas_sp.AAC.1